MRNIILLFCLPLLLFAKNEFMSEYEYGQMLYSNPRGISCVNCHGEFGEGKVIVNYKEEGREISLKGADIRDLNLTQFHKSLNSNHTIMPRYYLVNREVIAIYKFIQEKNRRLTQPQVDIEEDDLFIYSDEGNSSDLEE
ncbi:MAG: cytochrome c [Campylobacterales bacterium]|nr:cytochrome c [Campylobacterales bacterium]